MDRFIPAMRSDQTRRLILHERKVATSRGILGVPALVIGGRWLLSGLRDVAEYREHISACMQKRDLGSRSPSGHAVH